jgi:hypothetical protein
MSETKGILRIYAYEWMANIRLEPETWRDLVIQARLWGYVHSYPTEYIEDRLRQLARPEISRLLPPPERHPWRPPLRPLGAMRFWSGRPRQRGRPKVKDKSAWRKLRASKTRAG